MTRPDSSPGVNRRSVVAGSAWGVPAIIAATSAPAFAASRCAGGFNKHSWTVGWYGLTGIVGYVNDAHFWIKAFETPTPPGCRPDQAIDNYGDPAADTGGTVVVETRRASGSTSRLRSVLLTQGNPNYTNVTKTLDVINAKPWQIGKVDYRWEVTFAPGELAQRKEGVMVNLGNADGGVIDGRITHELVIDGKPTGHIF